MTAALLPRPSRVVQGMLVSRTLTFDSQSVCYSFGSHVLQPASFVGCGESCRMLRQRGVLFVIEFDRQHQTMLVAFSGTLSRADIVRLDDITNGLIAANGPHSVILDFSGVSSIDLTREDVIARANQPSREAAVRRVIVTSEGQLGELAGVFAAAQAFTGSTPPKLAATRDDAFAWLGIAAPAFRPIDVASEAG